MQDDGSYMWTDGWPVFFTQWGPGEPTNIKDEGCVSMHASRMFHGTWNDTKCDLEKPYICKKTSGTSSIRIELFFPFFLIAFSQFLTNYICFHLYNL